MVFAGFALACLALVSAFFLTGPSDDGANSGSDSYWRSEARPFAILEQSQTGSEVRMLVQNAGLGNAALSHAVLSGGGITGDFSPSSPVSFSTNEKQIIIVKMETPCAPGAAYEYFVTFTYSTEGISPSSGGSRMMTGQKPISGRCG